MKFPVVIRQRKAEAVIYAKSGKYPYYRVAYRIAGKRILRSFQKFADARQEAESKVREISVGNQSLAPSSREATEALAIRAALDGFCRATGRRFSAAQAVTGFLDALRLLPPERNLVDAVRGYLGTVAVVRRKPLAEAVAEFQTARPDQPRVTFDHRRPEWGDQFRDAFGDLFRGHSGNHRLDGRAVKSRPIFLTAATFNPPTIKLL